jgi:DNA-binding FadR family transcriptional regulator
VATPISSASPSRNVAAVAFLEAVRRRLAVNGVTSAYSVLLDFFTQYVCEHVVPGSPPKGLIKERFRKFRAGQIAHRILERYCAPPSQPGKKIGSEAELSALYRADRSITRQAIRLRRAPDSSLRFWPRQRHLTRLPQAAPMCRLACCYLSSRRLPVAVAYETFCAMSIEAISIAATNASIDDVQDFERRFTSNWNDSHAAELHDIFAAEDCQFSAVRNPLIELFLHTVRGYVALTVAEAGTRIPKEMADCFAHYTRHVLEAMARGEPQAAVLAHEHKMVAMREIESRDNPALAQILHPS